MHAQLADDWRTRQIYTGYPRILLRAYIFQCQNLSVCNFSPNIDVPKVMGFLNRSHYRFMTGTEFHLAWSAAGKSFKYSIAKTDDVSRVSISIRLDVVHISSCQLCLAYALLETEHDCFHKTGLYTHELMHRILTRVLHENGMSRIPHSHQRTKP